MMYSIRLRTSLVSLSLLAACSAEYENVSRVRFDNSPDLSLHLQEAEFHWEDESLEPDACRFLGGLRQDLPPTPRSGQSPFVTFQLYQSIFSDDGELFGAHAVEKVPQILYSLSKEGSTDEGSLYRSYDPKSFYKIAKDDLCKPIPTYCEKLNSRDEKTAELEKLRESIQKTQTEIAEKQAKLNTVEQPGGDDASALQRSITGLRVQLDTLIVREEFMTTEVETLTRAVTDTAKTLRKTATPEQTLALDNFDDLFFAIKHWNYKDTFFEWRSWAGVKEKFTKVRNEKIEEKINTRVPGALDDLHRPIAKSDIFASYVRYLRLVWPLDDESGVTNHLAAEIDTLRPTLTANLNMFPWDGNRRLRSWKDYERDVANTIALLSAKPFSLQDATCKFVLAQRFIAQLIAIKGIQQSPVLGADGKLEKLSSNPAHQVSHVDIAGVFGLPVTEDWVNKNFSEAESNPQQIPLPAGVIDPQSKQVLPVEYFAWLRAMAEVAASCNANFWIRDTANSGFSANPEELVPSALAKLSLGIMGFGLSAAKLHFIVTKETSTELNLLPKNTPEGFESLTQLSVDALRSFDEFYKAHQATPARFQLTEDQADAIKEKGKHHLLLNKLLYGASRESMKLHNSQASTFEQKIELRKAINRAGFHIKNETLYLFGHEGPRQVAR